MKPVPFVVQSERQIYIEYDRDRRLRISRVIAPAFAFILTTISVASLIVPQQLHGTRGNFGTVLLCDALFVVGAYAAWRRWVNLATGSILLAALLLMALAILVNQPFILSDLFTVPAVVIIGLSALIGLPWMILATTACTTAFVLVLSHSPSLTADLADPNNVNSIGAFVIEQWILALIVFAAARGYRRMLRLTSDVRVQYERAQQLDQLKDQFITSVNHELRNPVMIMQGYIELLRLKGEELAPVRRQQLIQRASDAGDALARLVQSILASRRSDQSAREFTSEAVLVFDAMATAAGLVDPEDGQGQERALHITVPPGLTIWGEPVRLQQILINLLSNALKYSPPGTPVEVTARVVAEAQSGATPAEGRWQSVWRLARRLYWRAPPPVARSAVEIAVRDHGFGIPPEQAPLLFERFVRLPRDLASTVVGNGMGLYLCRELAEAMGGRIWVESSGIEGEGATFTLRLPLPPVSASAKTA
jgi:signal transduction histidine kinase